ncbi:MAG: glycosyl transferase [Actinomycetota bacterium]|nr:glycosyl transferase [Actinomycetota bacterium]
MLALGAALGRRGHEVTLQTWERWRAPVEAAGMRFAPAPEYHVFPTRERPLKPYEAVVRAARVLEPELRGLAPDAIVADILTLAPALAGERAGVPVATLIPHVDPRLPPGAPPYSLGARWPRTTAGRVLWRAADRVVRRGLEQGRCELNETRRRLGLPAHDHVHNGISRALSLVGTFPQLEYPFPRPPGSHVVGPLLWEPPFEDVELPLGEGPLVLVAPSTAQDADHRLLRATLAGLADEPVRVLATWNRRPPDPPLEGVPANARVVDWLSYARTMPRCDLVVCHGGHGTVVRALASGCPVVIAPAAGDMNENAARVDWAGAGVRLPRRLVTPTTVRLAVVRALGEPSITARARELAAWAAKHDGAQRAAELVEAFANPSGACGNIRSWKRDGLSSD